MKHLTPAVAVARILEDEPTALQPVDLNAAVTGSYYTIVGAGDPLSEWVTGYNDLLEKAGIGKPTAWYTAKGADVNREFSLVGQNKFKDDLNFLFFPLDGLKVGQLAMFKLRMQDRWFDDVIGNSRPSADEEEPTDEDEQS